MRGSPPSLYIFNKSKRARGHLHCSTVTEQINSMHDSSNYFKHWDGHTSDDSKCGASRQKNKKKITKKTKTDIVDWSSPETGSETWWVHFCFVHTVQLTAIWFVLLNRYAVDHRAFHQLRVYTGNSHDWDSGSLDQAWSRPSLRPQLLTSLAPPIWAAILALSHSGVRLLTTAP